MWLAPLGTTQKVEKPLVGGKSSAVISAGSRRGELPDKGHFYFTKGEVNG